MLNKWVEDVGQVVWVLSLTYKNSNSLPSSLATIQQNSTLVGASCIFRFVIVDTDFVQRGDSTHWDTRYKSWMEVSKVDAIWPV